MEVDCAVQSAPVLRGCVELAASGICVWGVDGADSGVIIRRAVETASILVVLLLLHSIAIHQQDCFDEVPLQGKEAFLGVQ